MDQHFESNYPDNTRFEELQKLTRFIKEGTSVQLISIPGGGRSEVLKSLSGNKDKHNVLVNFQEIRKKPLADVLRLILFNLTGKTPASIDELEVFQTLKQALDDLIIKKKRQIVFLFDHFEEYVPLVTSDFFTHLKSLRSRYKYDFCVVFSVNRPLEDLLDESILSDFYEYVAGHYVYLKLYDKETTEFRVKYIEKITGKKLTDSLLKKIIDETGGVGRLVKLSVEALLASESKSQISNLKSQINSKNQISNFLFAQKPIQNALSEICRSLLPVEQNVLIRNDFEDQRAVEYLESVGIIKDKKIQIPLFEKHIATHREERQESEKKIIYSESDQTIRKGEKIISDQLTSSEFKLLKFLVQNSERVIERDEIISVVWSDVKSTAGITDQAVDQLIFRLRRKIEEDPNSPRHLQTVKGRGFRFTP